MTTKAKKLDVEALLDEVESGLDGAEQAVGELRGDVDEAERYVGEMSYKLDEAETELASARDALANAQEGVEA